MIIELDGSDAAAIAMMPVLFPGNMREALTRIGGIAQSSARGLAPFRSGELISALIFWMEGEDLLVGYRGSGPAHAPSQEFGFRWHFAPPLGVFVSKPRRPGGYFLHPGVEQAMANPGVDRALEEAVDKL